MRAAYSNWQTDPPSEAEIQDAFRIICPTGHAASLTASESDGKQRICEKQQRVLICALARAGSWQRYWQLWRAAERQYVFESC